MYDKELFHELFGNWAENIYKRIGGDYEFELDNYPEDYPDNNSKKDLIARSIVQQFQLNDSVFYE